MYINTKQISKFDFIENETTSSLPLPCLIYLIYFAREIAPLLIVSWSVEYHILHRCKTCVRNTIWPKYRVNYDPDCPRSIPFSFVLQKPVRIATRRSKLSLLSFSLFLSCLLSLATFLSFFLPLPGKPWRRDISRQAMNDRREHNVRPSELFPEHTRVYGQRG